MQSLLRMIDFLKLKQCRTWYIRLTLAEREKRAVCAWRRWIFLKSFPLLDCPIRLFWKVFPWHYDR